MGARVLLSKRHREMMGLGSGYEVGLFTPVLIQLDQQKHLNQITTKILRI